VGGERRASDRRRDAVHAAHADSDHGASSDGRDRPGAASGAGGRQGQSEGALRQLRRSGDGDHPPRQRVLVIDDDDSLCDAIREVLGEEYAVASAPHGAAALDLVKVHEPALILLDLRMPIMDGWSFVQQYRRGVAVPGRVIVMSAATDLGNIARQLGADGHLKKPFDLDDLRTLVTMELAGGTGATRNETQHADLPSSPPLT
jgi:CheY-like chemotaxis protein